LPDRAAAEDAHPLARPDLRQPDGMESNPERLEHRHVRVAQAVGHGDQAPARPGDELTESAVRGAVTGETNLETEMDVPGQTLLAFLAPNRRIDRDALAAARPRLDHAAAS